MDVGVEMSDLEECLKEAFTQGAIANINGDSHKDNPWGKWLPWKYDEWREGWIFAEVGGDEVLWERMI